MGSRTVGDVSASDLFSRRLTFQSGWLAASRWRSIVATCVVTLLLASTWAALAATYIYDPNGRLTVVTNDAGESARYRYDELGNLVEIERLAADDLAVFGFSPGRGAAGVAVQISGHGFSPTASQNTVKFNGTPASVSTASTTALTAIVPTGATTGPITVSVGGETASSVTSFIVDETLLPPTITNVSPLIASIGTTITVDGQSLAPIVNQTKLRLNQRLVTPATLTNLQAVFAVPPSISSGRISISTPYGTALSTQDVLVTPNGVLPGEIAQLKRLTIDTAAQGFSIVTTGHYGAAMFDGSAGDYLSAQFSLISVANISYTLYGVDNTVLASGIVSTNSPTFHLPQLPATGTYLLLMKPTMGPATWNVVIEKAKQLINDGAPLTVTTTVFGQRKRLTFTATQGANLGLGISDLVIPGATTSIYVNVRTPNGFQQAGNNCNTQYSSGCQLNLSNLEARTYTVELSPPSNGDRTMSFQTTLSSDVAWSLTRDVTSVLTLGRPGQNGRLTFAGTMGETVALQLADQATVPTGNRVYYYVYQPDGTLLDSTFAITATTLNLRNLPATGNYTVVVDSSYGETLSTEIRLASITIGNEEIDGEGGMYETLVPGQNAYLTFLATAGQNLGLGISDLIAPDDNGYGATVYVYDPNQEMLDPSACFEEYDGCGVNLSNLMAGIYTVVIEPPYGSNLPMSFKVTISSDKTTALTRNTPQSITLVRRGQNGRLTFAGVAGETVSLQVAGQATVPTVRTVYYTVLKPDGTILTSEYTTSAITLNLPNLPATGDYTLFVDPKRGETVTAQVTLATGTTGGMVVNGASGNFTTTVPGQNVYLTFTATAGQNLGLGLSDLVTPGSTSYMRLRVYRPDGSQISYVNCYASNNGCQLNLPNLIAGTYSVIIEPPHNGDQTMSFKATLSTDETTTLARNTAYALNLGRRGQNGRLMFAGTAGETVALRVAGQATEPAGRTVYYTVLRPNGTTLTSTNTTSAATLNLPNLPATGNYTIVVDPQHGETATAQVEVGTP